MIVCPGSITAIQGAVGTVCEAVDKVIVSSRSPVDTPIYRAFVAIRPPGHHCGEDTPSGFCFLNNVAIGAAHGDFFSVNAFSEGGRLLTIHRLIAHLQHGIKRIVIFDIDLHHGQSSNFSYLLPCLIFCL